MKRLLIACAALFSFACSGPAPTEAPKPESTVPSAADALARYAEVTLTTDLSSLTVNEKRMIPLLIDAASIMDDLFWQQAWGDKDALLSRLPDAPTRAFAVLNYGPWDRLGDNQPFVGDVGMKPMGANVFPTDLTKDEFDRVVASASKDRAETLRSLYTRIERAPDGSLVAVPYSKAYEQGLTLAAGKLREAAALAEDEGLKRYLELRATALVTDEYRPSDLAWMDMKTNRLDLVIGPIETYEEQICGCKAMFEAYVLVKDLEWSARLARYATLLPQLQRELPVPEEYKRESPGTSSDLGAYDALFYAGDCNAGAKTIAINLPNDETVQLEKGSRRLQLKNAMRAKFDTIVVPIANVLIAPDQREHVEFDAFFANTMFHEVAHGLGIKMLVDGSKTVADALAERQSTIEEGKADILGLYLVRKLHEMGEIPEADMLDNDVTFMAGLFRSIRFGAASAHGKANLMRFNFFAERGAFTRDAEGLYRVDRERFAAATDELAGLLLMIQGDGDYAKAGELMERYGGISEALAADLARIEAAKIPVDIRFRQGMDVLAPQL